MDNEEEIIDKDSVIESLQKDNEHLRERLAFMKNHSFSLEKAFRIAYDLLTNPAFFKGYVAGVLVVTFFLWVQER